MRTHLNGKGACFLLHLERSVLIFNNIQEAVFTDLPPLGWWLFMNLHQGVLCERVVTGELNWLTLKLGMNCVNLSRQPWFGIIDLLYIWVQHYYLHTVFSVGDLLVTKGNSEVGGVSTWLVCCLLSLKQSLLSEWGVEPWGCYYLAWFKKSTSSFKCVLVSTKI